MWTQGTRAMGRGLLLYLGGAVSTNETDDRDGYDFACTKCQSVDELYTLR